mmetsp:Transcript_8814/g.14133  ORF Transcript_8814/g.14133 Transcript_8814/m.14133 type:complete len:235 (+) Transcript_8814:1591-2295(+)
MWPLRVISHGLAATTPTTARTPTGATTSRTIMATEKTVPNFGLLAVPAGRGSGTTGSAPIHFAMCANSRSQSSKMSVSSTLFSALTTPRLRVTSRAGWCKRRASTLLMQRQSVLRKGAMSLPSGIMRRTGSSAVSWATRVSLETYGLVSLTTRTSLHLQAKRTSCGRTARLCRIPTGRIMSLTIGVLAKIALLLGALASGMTSRVRIELASRVSTSATAPRVKTECATPTKSRI